MKIPPLRTNAERLRDDHAADLRLCGIEDDSRDEQEARDAAERHYDFICGPSDGSPRARRAGRLVRAPGPSSAP